MGLASTFFNISLSNPADFTFGPISVICANERCTTLVAIADRDDFACTAESCDALQCEECASENEQCAECERENAEPVEYANGCDAGVCGHHYC